MSHPPKIGKYDVLGVIGRGGMGIVYKGLDPELDRHVAIKMITIGYADNQDLLKRFSREAQSTAKLTHPNIVTVYHSGNQDGNPYLVMEYIEGESLDAVIRSNRPLSAAAKIQVIVEICRGLTYAHERGIVHRDIKPANLMILKNGSVKIVDFGIARIADNSMTRTGQIIGSVSYMSPEQINGQSVDARSDIFSTGVVLYQLFTYALPFEGENTASTLLKIIHDPPTPLAKFLSTYPSELESILLRALAKRPQDRYGSTEDFSLDLMQVCERLNQSLVGEYLRQAQTFLQQGELAQARDQLLQLLKIDQKHTHALHLLRDVQQKLQKEQGIAQARELRGKAAEAFAQREFETALQLVDQAIAMDPANQEHRAFRERVRVEQIKTEDLQRALRRAEIAHQQGRLEEARQAADEALEVDPNDTRAKAVYRLIHRDWVEQSRQRQLANLLGAARKELSAGNIKQALIILQQAEVLDPQGNEVRALIESVQANQEQQRQREELDKFRRSIEEALDRDDYVTALTRAEAALRQFPKNPGLADLKSLAERQRDAEERKAFVQQQIDMARQWLDKGSSREALLSLQTALQKLPQEPQLQTLAIMAQERVAQQEGEEAKTQSLKQARAALDNGDYPEAIRLLELAKVRFVHTAEIESLLRLARKQKAEESTRAAVAEISVKAKQYISAHEYARAVQLLENSLRQTPNDELQIVLEEARRRAGQQHRDLQATIATARQYLTDGEYDRAAELLVRQPDHYVSSPEFSAVREIARRAQIVHRVMHRVSTEPDLDARLGILESAQKQYPAFSDWQKELHSVREQQKAVLAIVQRARKLAKAGKHQGALQEWQQLYAIHPDYPDLPLEIKRLRQQVAEVNVTGAMVSKATGVSDAPQVATSILGPTVREANNLDAWPLSTRAVNPPVPPRPRSVKRTNLALAAAALAILSVAAYEIIRPSPPRPASEMSNKNPVPSDHAANSGQPNRISRSEPAPEVIQDGGTDTDHSSPPPLQPQSEPTEEDVKTQAPAAPGHDKIAEHSNLPNQSERPSVAARSSSPETTTPPFIPSQPSIQGAEARKLPDNTSGVTPASMSKPELPTAKPQTTESEAPTVATATIPKIAVPAEPTMEPPRTNTPKTDAVSLPDRQGIEAVLSRYASAYNRKDLKEVSSLWPGAPKEKLNVIKDFFKSQKEVGMNLAVKSMVPLEDNRVLVRCAQVLRFSKDGKPATASQDITLYMVKRARGWEIELIPIT